MLSLSFEEVFGFKNAPQNECSDEKIEVSCPEYAENSDIYQKLIDICADPKELLNLLNIQVINHVRSGSPEHYTNYELSQMLNPFFSILPYILSDRSIVAQAHNAIINVDDFLSNWQSFGFHCIYSYFYQILSSKIYAGNPRKWLIITIFDLLSQNKKAYSNCIVTRIHAKDKQLKDKPNLHAIIRTDQTISIYYQNTCLKTGVVKYIPNDDFPIHQFVEMNDKKKVVNESRITFLDSNGEKITSDSADLFFNEGSPLYHLIWACLSCKKNEFSYESLDAISRLIFDFRGTFLQIFYYSQQNDEVFRSLIIASIFIHRHTFLLKTLIWAIYDDVTDQNRLFKSPFPAVRYLISFTRYILKTQISYLIEVIISFIDMYELDVDAVNPSDPLTDSSFKNHVIELFWETLLQISETFPKTFYDISFEFNVYSILNKQEGKSVSNPVKDLLLSEVIIPAMFDNLRKAITKNQKDCLNFVIKSITLTAASNKDDEFSRIGFKPLQQIVDKITQNPSNLNIKDIRMPSIQEYIDSVLNLIDCIQGSADYLRKSVPSNPTDFVTRSDEIETNDSSQNLLPITRSRTSRCPTGNAACLKDSDQSATHLQPFKNIPTDIFPWKDRISKEIFCSYYVQVNQDQLKK